MPIDSTIDSSVKFTDAFYLFICVLPQILDDLVATFMK